MNKRDQLLRDATAAALALAARRGSEVLEAAWNRFTPRQRQLAPPKFLAALRAEAAALPVAERSQ